MTAVLLSDVKAFGISLDMDTFELMYANFLFSFFFVKLAVCLSLDLLIFLRHILKNMKAKSSTQMGYFRRFFNPMFDNCVPTETMFVHVSEREIFH